MGEGEAHSLSSLIREVGSFRTLAAELNFQVLLPDRERVLGSMTYE